MDLVEEEEAATVAVMGAVIMAAATAEVIVAAATAEVIVAAATAAVMGAVIMAAATVAVIMAAATVAVMGAVIMAAATAAVMGAVMAAVTAEEIPNLKALTLINLLEQKAGKTGVLVILLKALNMRVVGAGEKGEYLMRVILLTKRIRNPFLQAL